MTGLGRSFLQALGIVVIGAGLGLLANSVSPHRIALITPPKKTPVAGELLTLEQAQTLWSSGAAIFLDARAPADYQAGHIAGAFNLPAEAFEAHYPQVAPMLSFETLLVVYCDGVDCELSQRLADQLRQLGHRQVRQLHNGWTVWRTAGQPIETGAP
jgi:rhodanese-related sulfurtransferase